MLRSVAVLLIASLGLGCSGRGAVAGGAATALTGALLISSAQRDNCPDHSTACEIFDPVINQPIDRATETLGIGMIVVGAVWMIAGLASTDEQRAPLPALSLAPIPIVQSGLPPPPLAANLPIASRLENRLAIQTTVAARRGDCAAAIASGTRLAELDAALHAKLLQTELAYAGCLDRRDDW